MKNARSWQRGNGYVELTDYASLAWRLDWQPHRARIHPGLRENEHERNISVDRSGMSHLVRAEPRGWNRLNCLTKTTFRDMGWEFLN